MEPPKLYGEGDRAPTGRARIAGKPRRRAKQLPKEQFSDLIAGSKDWLKRRVLNYAKKRDYARYTSTLAEPWRLSITGLSEPLLQAWQLPEQPPELGPDDDFTQDPIAGFGILEARRYQARGLPLSMFLCLMKCCRQSYIELVRRGGFEKAFEEYCRLFIDRFFDRVEIGFCTEFAGLTGKARAAEALRESEERYGLLFQSSNDAVFVHPPVIGDRAGTFVEVNDQACQSLGYTREELLNLSPRDLDDSELSDNFVGIREELLAEKPDHFETVQVAKDGSRIPVEIKARLFNYHGRPMVLSIVRDIGERQAAALALLEAAQKWRTTFDAIQDAVFLMDRESRITQANRALADLVQRPFGEIIGRLCHEVLHNAASPIADCPLGRMWESHQPETLVLAAGARWLKAAVEPSLNEAGEVTGMVHTVTDITDAVSNAAALKDSQAKLQRTLTGTVSALAATVETRDPYTSGHQVGVATLAAAIAEEMRFTPEQVEGMRAIGLLHDIGKIAIPAEILSKPGKISPVEFNLIKDHSQVGHDILKAIEFPWPLAQTVLQHHERLDGSGYPLGIKDADIIPEARILMVADVVESMAFHRPYRPSLGIDQALQEITQNKGILYDPEVVEACVRIFTEKGFKFS